MNTNEQNYTKDYSLLRKFDLEAAKNGERVLVGYGNKFDDCVYIAHHTEPIEEYVFDIKDHGFVVLGASGSCTHAFTLDSAKMKPLAWVEGKPVYKGDVLYIKGHSEKFIAGYSSFDCNEFLDAGLSYADPRLTWNKPKVKREGWINIYKNGTTYLHDTEEKAAKGYVNGWGQRSLDFVTTVRIEWEE